MHLTGKTAMAVFFYCSKIQLYVSATYPINTSTQKE